LFNLRHASAHSVIERIFGILKQHFRILQLPPEYDMSVQALVPPALAALHNFIRQYDPQEIHMPVYGKQLTDLQLGLHPESAGELGTDVVVPDESSSQQEAR
jgi:hypothetical protein